MPLKNKKARQSRVDSQLDEDGDDGKPVIVLSSDADDNSDEDDDFARDFVKEIVQDVSVIEKKDSRKTKRGRPPKDDTDSKKKPRRDAKDRERSTSTTKADEIAARYNVLLNAQKKGKSPRKSEDSDDDMPPGEDDEELLERHLKGRWRMDRRRPEQMTKRQRDLEIAHNPLIKLLEIEIELIADHSDEDASSLDSDSDSEEEDKVTVPKADPDVAMDVDDGEPPTEDEDEEVTMISKGAKADGEEEDEDISPDPFSRKATRAPPVASTSRTTSTASTVSSASPTRSPPGSSLDKDFPYKAKTRPRFLVRDATQDAIGPLVLGDGYQVPAAINRFLRDYQRDGVKFFFNQYTQRRGGILGDDMGLGKTIQVIAFLAALTGKTGHKADRDRYENNTSREALSFRAMIICPKSVVDNWCRELRTWGYFKVIKFEAFKHYGRHDRERVGDHTEVVVGGIEEVREHIAKGLSFDPVLVFVDEAHRLKSASSATVQKFHEFKTPYKFALTGTAIQNHLEELHTIIDWTCPGQVGNREQWKTFVSDPIKRAQNIKASDREFAVGRMRSIALAGLCLPVFMIRRTKEIIKDQLPTKTDYIVLCPMTQTQYDVYLRFVRSKDVKDIRDHDEPCECGAEDDEGLPYARGNCCGDDWGKKTFKYLAVFLKISNHIALIYPDEMDKASDPERFENHERFTEIAFPGDGASRRLTGTTFLQQELCGKWEILKGLLKAFKEEGAKVLLFSGSRKLLGLVKDLLKTVPAFNFVSLDGTTPANLRQGLVDKFNSKEEEVFIFLSTTKAGGVGLNLTAANKVVIFDPNWNPAHDLQAMDRAFRIGQERDVDVYRLVSKGTLEELVYNRQQYKRAIAGMGYDASAEHQVYEGVQGDKDNAGDLWGVKNLFKPPEYTPQEQRSFTEKMILRANLTEIIRSYDDIGFDSKDDEGYKSDDEAHDDEDDEKSLARDMGALVPELKDKKKLKKALPELKGAVSRSKTQAELDEVKRRMKMETATLHDASATVGGSKLTERRTKVAIRNSSKHTDPRDLVKAEATVHAYSSIGPFKRHQGRCKTEATGDDTKRAKQDLAGYLGFDSEQMALHLGDLLRSAGHETPQSLTDKLNSMRSDKERRNYLKTIAIAYKADRNL